MNNKEIHSSSTKEPPHASPATDAINEKKSARNVNDLDAMAPWLENVAFPKSREAILQMAEENTENDIEDNEAIMEHFRRIPDVVYNNIEEVRQALGDRYENYGGVKPSSKQ